MIIEIYKWTLPWQPEYVYNLASFRLHSVVADLLQIFNVKSSGKYDTINVNVVLKKASVSSAVYAVDFQICSMPTLF